MTYIPVIRTARIEDDAVTGAKVLNGTLTDADVAAANIDGVAGTPSLRTLGTGSQQALAGNTTLDVIANPVADLDMDGFKITDLGAPTATSDAATKGYVDSVAAGFDPKESVLYTTTGNITLSGLGTQANGTWPASLTAGDRILVKDQTAPDENGIYDAAAGAWTRSSDFDGTPSAEVSTGAFTHVAAADGTDYVGTGWVVTSPDPIVVNTDDIDWTQVSSPGSITNLDDLLDVDTAGAVDGALLRYESGATDWQDTTTLLFDDNGRLRVTTTGASAGIELGGDAVWYRSAADTLRTPDDVVVDGDATISGISDLAAGQRVAIQTVAGDHSFDLAVDYIIVLNTAAAIRTATLPATHAEGSTVIVKRMGANNAVIATADTDTIDGSASDYTIDVDNMSVTLVSDGTNWVVV